MDSARTPCFEHKVENEISKQSRPKTNTEKTQRKKAKLIHYISRTEKLDSETEAPQSWPKRKTRRSLQETEKQKHKSACASVHSEN